MERLVFVARNPGCLQPRLARVEQRERIAEHRGVALETLADFAEALRRAIAGDPLANGRALLRGALGAEDRRRSVGHLDRVAGAHGDGGTRPRTEHTERPRHHQELPQTSAHASTLAARGDRRAPVHDGRLADSAMVRATAPQTARKRVRSNPDRVTSQSTWVGPRLGSPKYPMTSR